jgi:hydroxymethylbilane synthase
MALVQAERVAADLRSLEPGADVQVVKVTTSGDRWKGALADLGGKGAFVRELDSAQLGGDVDVVVHCLKDIPSELPDGLTISAYLPREDVHDAVVSRHGSGLDDLPPGATVGTSSVRRTAQIAQHFPALRVEPIRGNADTRLRKLDDGHYDAVILAVAGLRRIGQADRITSVLPTDVMLPAVGAGVIAVTTRVHDDSHHDLVARLDDPNTRCAATAERVMLDTLAGHCHSPIAGLATTDADATLWLRGAVYSLDGSVCLEASQSSTGNPHDLGAAVASALLGKGARALIDSIDH